MARRVSRRSSYPVKTMKRTLKNRGRRQRVHGGFDASKVER